MAMLPGDLICLPLEKGLHMLHLLSMQWVQLLGLLPLQQRTGAGGYVLLCLWHTTVKSRNIGSNIMRLSLNYTKAYNY
jgi:hypothetical protein